jgi:hypothetical protein
MGLFSTLFGGSESKSDPGSVSSFPGLFSDSKNNPTGLDIGNFLLDQGKNRFNKSISDFDIPDSVSTFDFDNLIGSSAIGSQFQDELLNPDFGVSQAEQSLINEVLSQFQGSTAVRNLNVTGEGFAETLAPELVKFRQDRVDNLKGAFDSELNAILTGLGQEVNQRGQDVDLRQQDILGEQAVFDEGANLLLALADLSRPTPVSLQGGSTSSSQNGIFKSISDPRAKKNIKKISEFVKGISLYSFEYLWDEIKHIGFMADEVKKVIPGAVDIHESGYDMVDYGKVIKHGN